MQRYSTILTVCVFLLLVVVALLMAICFETEDKYKDCVDSWIKKDRELTRVLWTLANETNNHFIMLNDNHSYSFPILEGKGMIGSFVPEGD